MVTLTVIVSGSMLILHGARIGFSEFHTASYFQHCIMGQIVPFRTIAKDNDQAIVGILKLGLPSGCDT